MTILCPEEFAVAVKFAARADDALEAAIRCRDAKDRMHLEEKRGQGMKTLLQCFGWRAAADALDRLSHTTLDSTIVRWSDGRELPLSSLPTVDRPVRDTFVFSDFIPHSFFFREEWLDPHTRQIVELYSWCWYVFKGEMATKDVDNIPESDLPGLLGEDVVRTFDQEYVRRLASENGTDSVIRRVRYPRSGMCGGIVYHADYIDGKRAEFGSWATHT